MVVNLTAVGATAPTFLTMLHAADAPVPLASDLNLGAGQARPNRRSVRLGADRRFTVMNAVGSVHYIVDLTALVMG